MDAYRHGDSFSICRDLPGIDPGSIDLTVEQNVLTVRADRAQRPVVFGIGGSRDGHHDRLGVHAEQHVGVRAEFLDHRHVHVDLRQAGSLYSRCGMSTCWIRPSCSTATRSPSVIASTWS
jgi:hypothetical protein